MGGGELRFAAGATRFLNLKSMIALSGESSVVPFYHLVSDEHLPHIRHLYHYKSTSEFERDMDDLLAIYKPVDLDEFQRGSQKKEKQRKMLLTFDDGLVECHQVIAPILKRKGVPAVFFLNNHFIDNRDLFYRYKVSLLIDKLLSSPEKREAVSQYMAVSADEVVKSLLDISHAQLTRLDPLCDLLEVDFHKYLATRPVYMSSSQIKEMMSWGFDIGGHSLDHPQYATLNEKEMIRQTRESIEDLKTRFEGSSASFAFPFSSEGVPQLVIDQLLNSHTASLLLGISGLKKTQTPGYIQRIDMEKFNLPALEVLKIKYLHYLLRKPFGNHIHTQ